MRYLLPLFVAVLAFSHPVIASEPMVVLNYGADQAMSGEAADSTHPFRVDPNYSVTHEVAQDETLGHIMQHYYAGSGLNMKFVEMAIVQFNRHAFVRGNPHFLYAGKTLRLPSLIQMQGLLVGQKDQNSNSQDNGQRRDAIFFFGG
jgi:Tfp pilus assembly protein FimV